MSKTSTVICLLLLALLADLLSIRMVITEWKKFNSDPALTLFTQIVLALILIFYLLQIAKKKLLNGRLQVGAPEKASKKFRALRNAE